MMVALPTGTRRTLSSGDCDILIARHHRERRMTAVVTLTDITGAHWAIQLADGDLLNLRKTFDVLYAAGPDQVAEWWRDLNTKRVDGPT